MWESKKELKEELENAEMRAVEHFRKLFKIEQTIKIAELNKVPSVYIVDEIKKILVSDDQSVN